MEQETLIARSVAAICAECPWVDPEAARAFFAGLVGTENSIVPIRLQAWLFAQWTRTVLDMGDMRSYDIGLLEKAAAFDGPLRTDTEVSAGDVPMSQQAGHQRAIDRLVQAGYLRRDGVNVCITAAGRARAKLGYQR